MTCDRVFVKEDRILGTPMKVLVCMAHLCSIPNICFQIAFSISPLCMQMYMCVCVCAFWNNTLIY
jgi:hypothetical protein